MIRAKVNGCGALSVNSFQSGSPNHSQQSLHSSESQSQSSDASLTAINSEAHHKSDNDNNDNEHHQHNEDHPYDQSSECSQTPQCRNGSHTSVPKYLETNLSHIERVVLEIVETERQYVSDLNEIIQVYIYIYWSGQVWTGHKLPTDNRFYLIL